MKIIALMLVSVTLSISPMVSAETVAEAESVLLQLAKRNLTHTSTLDKLLAEKEELAQRRNSAKMELDEEKAELARVGKEMQVAIARAYSQPSAENEREAGNLSRSFTLAESIVRSQKLELERTQRKYNEVQQEIEATKAKINQTQQDIERQKERIHQLKEQALARAKQAQPSAKPVQTTRVERQKPQQPPSDEPAQPKVVEAKAVEAKVVEAKVIEAKVIEVKKEKVERKPEETAPLSVEEQLENINRHISNGSDW